MVRVSSRRWACVRIRKGGAPGAQTERPGVTRPVRTLLCGRPLPAALTSPKHLLLVPLNFPLGEGRSQFMCAIRTFHG
jgi:hypothetical protein